MLKIQPRCNFVIFAHGRSGSSSLKNILDCHPNLKVAGEPFHTENLGKLVPKRPQTEKELKSSLDMIFQHYTGFKTLKYQLPFHLNQTLLTSDLRIIFLRRKNLLKTAVSIQMAQQTNIWAKEDGVMEGKSIKPFDLQQIQDDINRIRKVMSQYEALTTAKCFKLTYEDLFEAPWESKLDLLSELFLFLRQKPFLNKEILQRLNPTYSKINSKGTYDMIPNIKEIKLLESEEVGGI